VATGSLTSKGRGFPVRPHARAAEREMQTGQTKKKKTVYGLKPWEKEVRCFGPQRAGSKGAQKKKTEMPASYGRGVTHFSFHSRPGEGKVRNCKKKRKKKLGLGATENKSGEKKASLLFLAGKSQAALWT